MIKKVYIWYGVQTHQFIYTQLKLICLYISIVLVNGGLLCQLDWCSRKARHGTQSPASQLESPPDVFEIDTVPVALLHVCLIYDTGGVMVSVWTTYDISNNRSLNAHVNAMLRKIVFTILS